MSVAVDSETALVRVPVRLAALFKGDELPQWALEAILIEAVREVKCSRGFMRDLLDMDFTTAEALLAERGVYYDYTPEELEEMVKVAMRAR